MNVRPQGVTLTTDRQVVPFTFPDAKPPQEIALDGQPTRRVRLQVDSVYPARDKDCAISEVETLVPADGEALALARGSLLRPGTVLTYRDVGLDDSGGGRERTEDDLPDLGGAYVTCRVTADRPGELRFAVARLTAA